MRPLAAIAKVAAGCCSSSAHAPISLRVEKGGNPDLVRESQRRRFKDVSVVDKVIELDAEWRSGERCLRQHVAGSCLQAAETSRPHVAARSALEPGPAEQRVQLHQQGGWADQEGKVPASA